MRAACRKYSIRHAVTEKADTAKKSSRGKTLPYGYSILYTVREKADTEEMAVYFEFRFG